MTTAVLVITFLFTAAFFLTGATFPRGGEALSERALAVRSLNRGFESRQRSRSESAQPTARTAPCLGVCRHWKLLAERRARGWNNANRRIMALKRTLLHQGSVSEAINLACTVYGNCATLWRRARCESHLNPNAVNRSSGASNLFQFLPSTWRSTPFGRFYIFSPYAAALGAGWMIQHGRGGEWVCR